MVRIERTAQEMAHASNARPSWRGEVPTPPLSTHGLSIEEVDRRFNERATELMHEFESNPSQEKLQIIQRWVGHALAFWQAAGAVSKRCHEMGMALIGNMKS